MIKMKKVSIDPKIEKKFSAIKIAYLFANNISVIKTPPREKKIARQVEANLRAAFSMETLENDINIKEWIEVAENMAITSEDDLPAHIGLVRRIISGRDIPKINNVIDAANITAAKYRCPVGVFDANEIVSDITLRFAEKGESYVPLFAEKAIAVNEAEIVYADQKGIFPGIARMPIEQRSLRKRPLYFVLLMVPMVFLPAIWKKRAMILLCC